MLLRLLKIVLQHDDAHDACEPLCDSQLEPLGRDALLGGVMACAHLHAAGVDALLDEHNDGVFRHGLCLRHVVPLRSAHLAVELFLHFLGQAELVQAVRQQRGLSALAEAALVGGIEIGARDGGGVGVVHLEGGLAASGGVGVLAAIAVAADFVGLLAAYFVGTLGAAGMDERQHQVFLDSLLVEPGPLHDQFPFYLPAVAADVLDV